MARYIYKEFLYLHQLKWQNEAGMGLRPYISSSYGMQKKKTEGVTERETEKKVQRPYVCGMSFDT